jgi:hypothetical protein
MAPYVWKWLKKDDLIPFWIVAFLLAGSFQPTLLAIVFALVVLDACYWTLYWTCKGGWKIGCWLNNWWQGARPRKTTPLPTPVSRNDWMQRVAKKAQTDYEATELLLRGLPLDDDEREVLTMLAKQRLLQVISRLTEN